MRRRHKRGRLFVLVALCAAVLALLAAGCGGDDGGGGEEGKEGKAGGEITVWAMGAEGEKLGQFAEQFMQENPDIKVKVQAIAWDVAHDKLITSVAGNKTPDVSQMGTTWMGEFAKTGALEEVPDDIDVDAFFDGARDTGVVGGTTYGVPWYIETRVLYYRTDIAQKAGLDGPPETWEELKDAAKAMQKKGGAKWGIGLQPGGIGAWQTFLPFYWQAGGDILSEDGEFQLDSPEMVEALEYYKSFYDEGVTQKSWPEGFDITPEFVNGNIPMFFSGPWHMGLIKDAGGAKLEGKWDVAPMPEQDSSTSFVGGSDLVVFSGSDNKDAAWKFVSWLSEAEIQVKWYETVAGLPAVEAAWDESALSDDEQLQVFGEQLNDAKSPPAIPKWEEIAGEIDGEIEKVTSGNTAPDAAAQAMQEKASSIGAE
ncbi:MAG: sugar ABC transporter substrate-binding protein [Actinobacteria bacterium]|nr:sugar ABC transporter substrate-binding protein [Actinomycetota bacterium]